MQRGAWKVTAARAARAAGKEGRAEAARKEEAAGATVGAEATAAGMAEVARAAVERVEEELEAVGQGVAEQEAVENLDAVSKTAQHEVCYRCTVGR